VLKYTYKYFRELYFALGILIVLIISGTIGFIVVESYQVVDAFYMTIITISTVGFKEVQPLTIAGKLFTSFLIITSFGTFAFAISSITRYLLSGEYKNYFRDYRVNKTIDQLKNHVIVCGYGRNGRQAVRTLLGHKQSYVVIEKKEHLLDQMRLEGTPFIQGDATKEEVLIKAGIYRAKSLITTLPSDSENVFVVLTSREMSKKIMIISRASEDSSDRKLRIAGANNVIMPDKVGGAHMASLVVTPDVVEFLDHISVMGANEMNLEEISFNHIPEAFRYKSLGELNSNFNTGCLVIGFKTKDGEYIVNPGEEVAIVPDCKLFVLGTSQQIKELNALFNIVFEE